MLCSSSAAPLAYRFPASGTPVIDDSIGLVKGAPHPKEAKASSSRWAASRRRSWPRDKAFRLPARTDLPPAELPEWARECETALVPAEWTGTASAERARAGWSRWDREVPGGTAKVSPEPETPFLVLDHLDKRFGGLHVTARCLAGRREERDPRSPRPVRQRQDDGAADGRRLRDARLGPSRRGR